MARHQPPMRVRVFDQVTVEVRSPTRLTTLAIRHHIVGMEEFGPDWEVEGIRTTFTEMGTWLYHVFCKKLLVEGDSDSPEVAAQGVGSLA